LFIVASSVAAARCIYREDLPRVTTSRNRLGLSLSKRIRHRLVVKINGKRRPQTYEVLAKFWWTIHTHVVHPRPSPHLATPHFVWQASTRVCFSLSSHLHTIASRYRAIHLITRLLSTSTSNVGLKSYHPPCMNDHLRFIRNY
jgi:hypothetical protein